MMTFGQAIYQAEQGRRIYRKGWNGKNMFVAYMPAITIDEQNVNGRTKHFVPTVYLHVKAYFALRTADGGWQPGWVPSQEDMLWNDWEVIPEATP
jgi:hypothetical protein